MVDTVVRYKHKVDGKAVEVCRYVQPPPPKPVPTYSNRVFIKDISEKTTQDGLKSFLKFITNMLPISIQYGELKGKALVTFKEDIGQ